MPLDVRKLLKVYNVVNDEKRHKVNLKFAGALVAFVASGVALVAMAIVESDSGSPGAFGQDDLASTEDASETECFSVPAAEIGDGLVASTQVEELYTQWRATHEDAEVESVTPLYAGDTHVGYCVTFTP